ncbi:MAG: helix-turn-helix domain-containing protein [Bdellovibrionaceae bacterium]|nr:helix-turn-helix domain-containing protein [Pseudobdellovibrionaceae bacterium]
MKKTGEFLRKAREDKGLSIHEIGLSLKINPKILKQIEDGDKDNLPAKTFLRGFVQSYALFLKLDPNEVLKTFSEEMGTTKPNQISLNSGPQIRGTSIDIEDSENKNDLGIKRHTGQQFTKEKFEFKNIGIGIVVFVLLLSLIAVRKIVEKYQKEAEVDVAKTEENLKTNNKLEMPQAPTPASMAAPTDTKSTPLQGDPTMLPPPDVKPAPTAGTTPSTPALGSPGGGITSNTQKPTSTPPLPTPNAVTGNPLDSTVQTTPNTNLNPGLPATKPSLPAAPPGTTVLPKPTVTAGVPTNTNKPAVTPTPTALTNTTGTQQAPPPSQKPATTSTNPSTTATPPAPGVDTVTTAAPAKPKNIELVIEAFETVEIEMTQSSGKIEKIRMSPSQIQTFKTVSGVKLNISNGGAVNLIVNGKNLGVPGDLGKPKRVSF